MCNEHHHFQVAPIVVPADERTTISVTALPPHRGITGDDDYELSHLNREGPKHVSSLDFELVDGGLVFDADFIGEQEHLFRLERVTDTGRDRIADFHVYSVGQDLLNLRPLKGDFHLHSNRSDGLDEPARVAARCREIGLDFMALTDHHQYEPSLEAIAAFAGVECDLRLYPGEEVHPPGNPVHMINLGGGQSVNAMFKKESRYRDEVLRFRDGLAELPAGVDPDHYASTVWSLQQIQKSGGLAIFCHPYWVADGRYPVDARLTDHVLAETPFDAFEVIGGYFKHEGESNALQVARYHEERAKGNDFPVVGLSDSHGCDTGKLFGWYHTIVFAENHDLTTLIAAIKDFKSVAVEHVEGEQPRVHGRFRLVKLVHFLLREYFPRHDQLCAREGVAMQDHIAGKPEAKGELARLKGQCAVLHKELYALPRTSD